MWKYSVSVKWLTTLNKHDCIWWKVFLCRTWRGNEQMQCKWGECTDNFISPTLYQRFVECCLIKTHACRAVFDITANDFRILMSYEMNKSAAHTWPLLALSCITVIKRHKADFGFSLCRHGSPFTHFQPDTGLIFLPYLVLPRLFSRTIIPPPPLLPTTPFSLLYVTSRAVGDMRDPASKAPSLLSDRPQSQSLPLSAAEVYTHGKLIPMPCLPHIVLMSKVVRCGETGVTF